MTRRVEHRRIATIQLVNAFLGTIVALGLARAGQTLWALLAVDLLLMVATIFAWYVYRPVWRPRFAWDRQKVRYFLRFGSKNFTATLLLNALNRVDDLWTQYFLSTYSLGLYSRAYKFATYPGIILANPVHMVAAGTYAELKENRRGLSRAFFRINAIMIRSGFLLAGLIGLIAPEFILLALGDKWLPMLGAFRYMLLFTLFDPVKRTIGGLFVAVGQPGELARVRFFQLIVLLVGLFTLGFWLDITGVAIAVDLMLLAGIVVLLFRVRAYVDYSVVQLMAAPGVALAVAIAGTYLALGWLPADASPWLTGSSKTAVFSLLYGVLLAALEWREILSILGGLQRMFRAGET